MPTIHLRGLQPANLLLLCELLFQDQVVVDGDQIDALVVAVFVFLLDREEVFGGHVLALVSCCQTLLKLLLLGAEMIEIVIVELKVPGHRVMRNVLAFLQKIDITIEVLRVKADFLGSKIGALECVLLSLDFCLQISLPVVFHEGIICAIFHVLAQVLKASLFPEILYGFFVAT